MAGTPRQPPWTRCRQPRGLRSPSRLLDARQRLCRRTRFEPLHRPSSPRHALDHGCQRRTMSPLLQRGHCRRGRDDHLDGDRLHAQHAVAAAPVRRCPCRGIPPMPPCQEAGLQHCQAAQHQTPGPLPRLPLVLMRCSRATTIDCEQRCGRGYSTTAAPVTWSRRWRHAHATRGRNIVSAYGSNDAVRRCVEGGKQRCESGLSLQGCEMR